MRTVSPVHFLPVLLSCKGLAPETSRGKLGWYRVCGTNSIHSATHHPSDDSGGFTVEGRGTGVVILEVGVQLDATPVDACRG